MNDLEKYYKVFVEIFDLQEKDVNDDLEYNSIPAWDSVGHMGMIAELEDVFGIMLEMDEIIDFSSVGKGKEILSKHGVEI
tara:strand:+ start:5576 stop:5815 length:240 start_codon:yes stop_codon:yes gene_type:complete